MSIFFSHQNVSKINASAPFPALARDHKQFTNRSVFSRKIRKSHNVAAYFLFVYVHNDDNHEGQICTSPTDRVEKLSGIILIIINRDQLSIQEATEQRTKYV